MMTRWRLYILAVLAAVVAACVLFLRFLRGRGIPVTAFRGVLFTAGVLLSAETLIMAGLSNFNLGVILPALLGLPLIPLSLFWPHCSSGVLLLLRRAAACCYVAAAAVFCVCGILMLSANLKARSREAAGIVVLGAAVHGDRVTWVLENRLAAAMEYMNAHPGCVCVVSGGQGNGESVTEAYAMKKYMAEHGVDPARILLEERATNTSENFTFSRAMLDGILPPGAPLAFVTTDFHVFRAGRVAARLGLDAFGVPAPDVWYLRLNNFLRESVAICVYALRGQL